MHDSSALTHNGSVPNPRAVTAIFAVCTTLAMLVAVSGCEPADGTGQADRPSEEPPSTASRPGTSTPAQEEGGPAGHTTTVDVGGVVLRISPGEAATVEADTAGPGTRTVTVSLVPGGSAQVAVDSPGELDVDPDGSVVVLDGSGTPVAALGPPSPVPGTGDAEDPPQVDVTGTDGTHTRLELDHRPLRPAAEDATERPAPAAPVRVTFVVGTDALEGAAWEENEGGRSLAVDPTDWARHAGEAGLTLIRTQLVAAEPEADSETMGHQLMCHAVGAPDKATWNLEPWRPDVGLILTAAAHCNPV